MADCCTTQGRTRARCLAGPRRAGTRAGARRWRPTTAGRRRGRAPCSSGPPPASASSSAPPPPPPPHNGEYTPRNKPLSAHGHEPAALMPGAGPGGSLKVVLKIACVTPHTPWGREVRGSKQTTLVRGMNPTNAAVHGYGVAARARPLAWQDGPPGHRRLDAAAECLDAHERRQGRRRR